MCLGYQEKFELPEYAYKVAKEENLTRTRIQWRPLYYRWWANGPWSKSFYHKRGVNIDPSDREGYIYDDQDCPYPLGFHLWATLDGARQEARGYGDCVILKVTYDDVVATGYQYANQVVVARTLRVVKKVS